jgi:hypothetical protein
MIYLKTQFYTPTELNFINLNIAEAYDKVDGIIVTECDIHHTGRPNDFIFEDYKHMLNPKYMDKVIYLKCELRDKAIDAYEPEKEHLIHKHNEPLMRGHFVKLMDFDDEDIIISVDGDEIIYKESYDLIIEEVKKRNKVNLNLNQFFYRLNYYWENKNFIAPTASKYKMYKNSYPNNWRYDGHLLPNKHGCHFSWCMTPEQMMYKLDTYSHPMYRKCAKLDLLEDAVQNKKYPFDPKTSFNIKEIELDNKILPNSLRDEFFEEFRKKFFN